MTAYLILSDIHSNLDALEAVLDAVEGSGTSCSCSAISSATAPSPTASSTGSAALEPLAVIRGNHDKAACGIDDASNFNQIAKYAASLDRRDADRREPRVPAGAAGRPGA